MRESDYRKNIMNYFKKNLKKGYTLESLKFALIGQGYLKSSVERVIKELNKDLAKKAPILKEKPIIKREILDENYKPIKLKKKWWKRLFWR